MDPQQRITTEVTWEALEDAGISPQDLAGSNTAVFVGVNSDDYSKLLLEDLPGVEAWMGIGTAYCGVPNRISYLLDLRGPSTAVDAACASSLVAIHHGRQSLLTGETDLAIVGGVNALCGPGLTRVLDEAGAISKDGTCRSFDNEANGYGRGEGASIIILKRMADALADNDKVLAVLKGSAVGQDGRTNGIMAPNGEAQEQVARTALGTIDPSTIQYVEAHATSTSVGDPVEIGAMSHVYGANRTPESPCYVGSIKPNIGHLEAGAGAMGFTKAILAINKGVIPPQANLKSLNTKIDWTKAGIKVPFEATEWPKEPRTKRAAICSYGYGGTVSHAVIEAAPQPMKQSSMYEQRVRDTAPTVLLLSAPQEKRIPVATKALGDWLARDGKCVPLESTACTLATRRGHHDYRTAFVVENRAEAQELIEAYATNQNSTNAIVGRVLGKNSPKGAVWMFSGHGSQWPAMGQQLLAEEPVFLTAIAELEATVQAEANFSILSALETGDFDSSDRVQILTFAMQIGLAAVLRAKGVKPSAIIGHSVGEIAACVVSGALTTIEGATVVCKRAVLYRQFMGKGAMILVNASFEEMAAEIGDRLDIGVAIHSSPNSCVVSGNIKTVEAFSKTCEGRGIKVFRVKSDVPFHSPVLNPIAAPLIKQLNGLLAPKTPTVPLYSTATQDSRQNLPRDASYWARNMLRPVLLTGAIRAAAEDGHLVFLEVSAHPVITHSVNETLMDLGLEDACVVPTLLRNKPTKKALLNSLAAMWVKGVTVEWKKHFAGVEWAHDVPRTIWKHQSFWKEIGTGSTEANALHDVDKHTLLGQRVHVAGEKTTVFTTRLDDTMKPFPGSHPLHGTEIVPAAVLFNTFFHASGKVSLHNIHLHVPVAISAPRSLQVIVHESKVRLMSRLIQNGEEARANDESSWLTHTSANLSGSTDGEQVAHDIDVSSILSRLTNVLEPTFSIDYLANVGVPDMGFPWAVISHVGDTEEMLALVNVDPSLAEGANLKWDSESWAPIFDAATSIGSTIFYEAPRLRMPAEVEEVAIYEGADPPKLAYIYVKRVSADLNHPASDVTVTDVSGKALAKFTAMRFSEIEGTPGTGNNVEGLVHQLAWKPVALASEPKLSLSHVLVVAAKNHPMLATYKKQLERRRIKVTNYESSQKLVDQSSKNVIAGTIILYLPGEVEDDDAIPAASNAYSKELLDIVKYTIKNLNNVRTFVITDGALSGATTTSLAHAPLVGLGRIIAAEQPDVWGALIDVDSMEFPFQAIKYISGADVIKVEDTISRIARLRPMPQTQLYPLDKPSHMSPRPEGTYVISGGLGALGLEVASYLSERGARRIVLLSRRALPPRKLWGSPSCPMFTAIQHIRRLERAGTSIYSVALDLGSPNAAPELQSALDALSLPPVLGVVHAAGIVEDQLIHETTPESFERVLAPKVAGTLALHQTFPVNTLDFFILFSSCGQLFGFPGQGSYASGNAFLDSMAEHRRAQGDNTIAFQWTSWRGLGMAASTPESEEFIEAELEGKGITSIDRDEAFRAWDHVAKYDTSHGVVLRSRILDADDLLPMDILEDVVIRRAAAVATSSSPSDGDAAAAGFKLPPPGPERLEYLRVKISECVASVLQLPSVEDVDAKAALADMGMDSVMTVALRRQLQQGLKVKVPPTLIWGHPTVGHLVKWFAKEME